MTGKGRILRVGLFRQWTSHGLVPHSFVEPVGWLFDCEHVVRPKETRGGITYWAGWTLEELVEVSSRPSEFVEIE